MSGRPRAHHSNVSTRDLENMQADLGPRFLNQRISEKARLEGLNNRFASYVQKVRNLQLENTALEAKLRPYQDITFGDFEKIYNDELKKLQDDLTETKNENERAEESDPWREERRGGRVGEKSGGWIERGRGSKIGGEPA